MFGNPLRFLGLTLKCIDMIVAFHEENKSFTFYI